MKYHQNHPARPEEVAVNNEQASQRNDADALTEAQAADQQYLYQVECLVAHAMDRSRLEVGRVLIREGAVALDDSPDYFDRSGRITASGLEAIIAGGLGHVWRELREAMHNWRGLTLREINAIRELRRVPPIAEEREFKK